jgi:PAS domain S-box-containing protein
MMGGARSFKLARKDGSEINVKIGLGVMFVGTDRMTLAAVRDVSLLEEAQRAQAHAEQNFRLAFENNIAPMILADLDDGIIAANDAFSEMVGWTREELVGGPSRPFTHPDDVGKTEQFSQPILKGEVDHLCFVRRYIHKDGWTVVTKVSKSPAVDDSGNILYFIISARDITYEQTMAAHWSHLALHDPRTIQTEFDL